MTQPTHIDENGLPTMVDVGGRTPTRREATARADVRLTESILALARDGEIFAPKGPVFSTAVIAGTQAAKRTSDLIPFCHPLPVEKIRFSCRLEGGAAVIECTVACTARTGVEMEALTGATLAALTVYDMCKAVDLGLAIESVRLLSKSGGRRNFGIQA
ncbi:MAG: cyclic pyranopterin monophosphate synthase MoaC [Fibrobacteria bacterium]|nr:cyclic pyranopterin monophosphate synthase MoaC [Fibrobacteria bacterium]